MKEIFKRMQRVDELIQIKGTGSPSELAAKIGIAERTVYDYLKLMKEFGAPIQYSRSRRSYTYKYEGNFSVTFISN